MSKSFAIADAVASLESGIARLEACKLNDNILAWPYGLGVKFENGVASVVAVYQATGFVHLPARSFFNGKGEPAVKVSRQGAIRAAVAELRKTIESLRALPVE